MDDVVFKGVGGAGVGVEGGGIGLGTGQSTNTSANTKKTNAYRKMQLRVTWKFANIKGPFINMVKFSRHG